MGRLKFSIHPLFFAVGFYFALTGKILTFIIYTLTAVIHEIGHAIVSANLGYKLNKLILMPFGAVVSGDIEGLKTIDEIKVAMAGPLVNLVIALFFISVWWIFPETYAFTDSAVEANLTLAVINFIPAYPLDGGRVLYAILNSKISKKKCNIICKCTGITLAIILLVFFIISIFYVINFSILFFALFVFFGAVSNEKENHYISIFSILDSEKLKRGINIKKFAVDENISIKKLITLLDFNSLNEVDVYKNNKKIANLSHEKLINILSKNDLYANLSKYVK